MTYDTLNPVPSTDPRDLDDNAQALDRFLNSSATQEPDRLGDQRLTWAYVEAAAGVLVNPNLIGLSALTSAAGKAFRFTSNLGVMATYDISALGITLAGIANAAAGRTAIGALGANENAASATKLATGRTLTATGDASWSVSFDGTANATAAITLANTGITAGTYGAVTIDAKGRATAGTTATPVANGGTGQTTAANARTALGAAASGANGDITSLTGLSTPLSVAQGGSGVATAAAQVDALRAIKPAWTAYTPTVTASTGTFTAVTATGKYLLLFGVCHVQIRVVITTKGTGVQADVALPFPALGGSVDNIMPARETATNGKIGAAVMLSSLTTVRCKDYANADLITADGSTIIISGSYPIA